MKKLIPFQIVFLFILALAALAACPSSGTVKDVGLDTAGKVWDCTTAEVAPELDALYAELAPLIVGTNPNWKAVYARGKDVIKAAADKESGIAIAGCTIAKLVQNYLGNRKAPPQTPAHGREAYDTLERFRDEEAGGGTFEMLIDGRRVRL